MEKRIELEKRGRPANQITELNLDNCRSTNIVGLTDEFTALESLSLINVGLTSLKGFPKLPNLKKLELSDNRISNGLNNLSASTKLTHLNLSGNKIKDLEELKPLDNFKELEVLDLFNNEATTIDSYRQKIFAMIPSLVYLDGFDVNDVEAVSDGEDDEEVNGNDSDEDGVEDYSKPFCINGLEIDLTELELYEKELVEKRKQRTEMNPSTAETSTTSNDNATVDEIDEYLDRLALDLRANNDESISTNRQPSDNNLEKSLPSGSKSCSESNQSSHTTDNNVATVVSNKNAAQISTPFPLLLFGFLSILAIVNSIHFSKNANEGEDDDDPEEFDDDDESEENGGLADVYNDDLENDDNDDDFEADENEDSDGDSDLAEEEEGEDEEESPARGTKRKHEGEEDDNDG
ncbi:acidic leucine-rich nuclear phosphoprotein 32 family member A isoform X1 [Contarinia nasturtii]|uniref:acidic leucine-rich nuclear phosphoprotein 32 family member A isoform X1 n=1 Tax=Contarinia nasturtii TaxID=265458 RepID=UPI0012D4ACB3|nr:acidic leucine-rich nuclear phosphoprotein 32 family member A isoform X1 [Contarinia nasturtii]XP_031635495.1 acidic leucine-rich nuclear phosphoprotein 32 family member A isoform X1 [Contarinia nasturtii]